MLKFPKDYFEGETIDDFFVESEMKHAWAAQLEVYKVVEKICQKHDLKMFAFWGTMIGAIRHKGFIPWDDDLDIGMVREDYDKFWQYAMEELPEGYVIMTASLEPEWDEYHGRIANSNKIHTGEEWMMNNQGCPYVVGIDIFPLDHMPNDKKQRDWVLEILAFINSLIGSSWEKISERVPNEKFDQGIKFLEETFGFEFYMEGNMSNQLRILYDTVCASIGKETDDLLCNYPLYIKHNGKHVFHKIWFDGVTPVEYEGTTILLPAGFDPIMSVCYGENFMVPIKGGASHDYPFYKEQREMLKEGKLYDLAMSASQKILDVSSSDEVIAEHNEIPTFEIKDEWATRIKNENKKVLLYALNSASLLKYGEEVIKKIERNIRIFAEKKDELIVILAEDAVFSETLKKMYPRLTYKYDGIKAKIRKECGGIVADRIDYNFASICDAYYGHGTRAMGEFLKAKKPIMIEDVSI
ncbi:MAG: LicD family protein [Lachnospiraceae bacterium]|nr:LicD family protein [Lachnospiraceae bacterium]